MAAGGAIMVGTLFQFANLSPMLGAFIGVMLALLVLFVDRDVDQ